jgi:hypothetical protein
MDNKKKHVLPLDHRDRAIEIVKIWKALPPQKKVLVSKSYSSKCEAQNTTTN